MATASASAASGVEALEAGSSILTIIATWGFSACPTPTTVFLMRFGGVFRHRKVPERERRQRDPARLAEFQRRLGIAVDEGLLDRRLVRPVPLDEYPGQRTMNSTPAGRRARSRRRSELTRKRRSSASIRRPRSIPSLCCAAPDRRRGCELRRCSWNVSYTNSRRMRPRVRACELFSPRWRRRRSCAKAQSGRIRGRGGAPCCRRSSGRR